MKKEETKPKRKVYFKEVVGKQYFIAREWYRINESTMIYLTGHFNGSHEEEKIEVPITNIRYILEIE